MDAVRALLAKAEASVRASFPAQTAERMISLDDTDARLTLGDLRALLSVDLLAEAEARGYERGKRDALTEAAADLPWTYRQQSGLPDHAERLARWLRARAAETPGGAA